jgi:glutamate-1-semialdehyde 2,1-aminomutase
LGPYDFRTFEPVVQAVIEKAKLGTSFGNRTGDSNAALAVLWYLMSIIRFVNSGTGACMGIRLARGFAKKRIK